jgi:hypothetical protein
MLKDSPFHDASAVLVTFNEVSVHQDTDADFSPLKFDPVAASRTCDLLRLQKDNAQDVLGIGTLDAGHYTQVRLAVAEAKLIRAPDGDAWPRAVPPRNSPIY